MAFLGILMSTFSIVSMVMLVGYVFVASGFVAHFLHDKVYGMWWVEPDSFTHWLLSMFLIAVAFTAVYFLVRIIRAFVMFILSAPILMLLSKDSPQRIRESAGYIVALNSIWFIFSVVASVFVTEFMLQLYQTHKHWSPLLASGEWFIVLGTFCTSFFLLNGVSTKVEN